MKNNIINPKNDNIFNLNSKIVGNKMNNEYISEENKIVKHWYFNLLVGITLILVALWVFSHAEITYTSLSIIFSLSFFFAGLAGIIFSIQYRDLLNEWGLLFAVGIIDLLASITVILQPNISTGALALIMGYVFLCSSVKIITWSKELEKYVALYLGWLLFGGVFGVIISSLFLWNGILPALSLLFFTSFALLIIGISEIYFSRVLRKLKR